MLELLFVLHGTLKAFLKENERIGTGNYKLVFTSTLISTRFQAQKAVYASKSVYLKKINHWHLRKKI